MNKDVLKQAIDTHGYNAQLDMCIEEMSELTKEICKYKRGSVNRNAIIEELADVTIMLEQLKIMFSFSKRELNNVIDSKVDRLKNRIKVSENSGMNGETGEEANNDMGRRFSKKN